jgi:hypothetical protein
MYATHAVEDLFGIRPDDMVGKSFFECIQEPFLQNAVNALDRAKENNSIAYLVFTWRDPRPYCGRRCAEQRNSVGWNDEDDEEIHSSGSEYEDEDLEQPLIFVEAVVSCTSDGLVAVLRHLRFPSGAITLSPTSHDYCASPWAAAPLMPPQISNIDFMETIRQVAVFAWCVQSLNESIRQYAEEGEYDHTEVLPASPLDSSIHQHNHQLSNISHLGTPSTIEVDGLSSCERVGRSQSYNMNGTSHSLNYGHQYANRIQSMNGTHLDTEYDTRMH